MVDRRTLLLAVVFACGCGQSESPGQRAPPDAGPKAASESRARIPRVAILMFGAKEAGSPSVSASAAILFRNRMQQLGHVEGKTVAIEENYADGDPARLTRLAQDIVASKPDVIVTIAASATSAARQATSTIPIVMAHAGSPVESGLVASLAHPGGNVTGTTSLTPDLGEKQVDLLRELVPGLARIGVLANPGNAGTPSMLANVNKAAARFNIRVDVAEVTRAEDIDKAFAFFRDKRPDALFVMMEPMIGMHRERIVEFAATSRLPASYDVGPVVAREGGLISYGPVLTSHYAQAADYTDKILKGASPSALPVAQSTEFRLVINLKTAKALGLAVPPSILVRADEVIQ